MFCGNCGAKLNEGDRFCTQCGMAAETIEPQKMVCKHCGKTLKEASLFCPECGYRISDEPVDIPRPQKPDKGIYRLTIVRPSSFLCCAMTFHIRVDGESAQYDIKNGQTTYVALKPGPHKIEVGMFGAVQKSVGTVNMNRDRTITCRVNPAGAYTNGIASGPVFLEDEHGNRLS